MPLLHRDPSRGGGGSRENRRSLADFLEFGSLPLEPAAPSREDFMLRDNEQSEWRWNSPSSPEAAQTPRSVPPNCFPRHHPTAFASFSESARPGSGWSEEAVQPSQAITDLVNSMKALAMPASSTPRVETSIQMRVSCYDQERNVRSRRSKELQESAQTRDERLARRASFCGVLSSGPTDQAKNWRGILPPRVLDDTSGYSVKVFLGGLPWDITEPALLHALRQFHPVRVEWPGREGGVGMNTGGPRGYAYVTFENERRVRALLAASRQEGNNWFFRVHTKKARSKEVQVIPWAISDASWVCGGAGARLQHSRTVFVGALHGMLSAHALATIMNDLFQGVEYAGIDTDKNRYPIGSGRVTFNNVRSYVHAVSVGYINIITNKFTKRIQVDPYLEDAMCSVCDLHQGPYFCREPVCFSYFCRSCWTLRHPSDEHKPLMRTSKSSVNGNLNCNSLIYATNGNGSNGSFGQRSTPPSDQGSLYNGANGGLGQRSSPPGDHGSLYNVTNEGFGQRSTPPSDQGSLYNGTNGSFGQRSTPPSDHGSLYNVPNEGFGQKLTPPSDQGSLYNGTNGGLSQRSTLPSGQGSLYNGNNGFGQRSTPPSDHGSVYSFQQTEDTGSPCTSGASAGSDGHSEHSDPWLSR